MTLDTYHAQPVTPKPSRLVRTEAVIRDHMTAILRMATNGVSPEKVDVIADVCAKELLDELLELHLIGLAGSDARTSVDANLIAALGFKHHCRKGDDADDVVRTAVLSKPC